MKENQFTTKNKFPIENLTDEDVLKEFVKRFKCDGAILIYSDSGTEVGFARWRNSGGRKWVNRVFKNIKEDAFFEACLNERQTGVNVSIN